MKSNLFNADQCDRRRSERRLQQASEAAQLGTLEWDIDRNAIWITNKGRELYGFSPEESIDLIRFLNAIHPDDRDAVGNALHHLRDEKYGDYQQEYRVLLPSGRVRWIAARGRIDTTNDSTCILRGVSFDITDRKKTDDCFRLVVESVPNGMVMFNPDGKIILINKQIEEDFGYSRRELVGRSIETIIPNCLSIYESASHEPAGNIRPMDYSTLSAIPSIKTMPRETIGLRKDNTTIPLEISFSPIPSIDGDRVLIMSNDISTRKQTEHELEHQRNKLAHLSRMAMLTELSGALAHQLNQPLAAILINTQTSLRLLANDKPNLTDIRDILDDIVEDGRRAGEVIRGLHLLLKKGELRYEWFDLRDMIQNIVRIMHHELSNSGIALKTTFAKDLTKINGDKVQLQQVVLNLLVNSREAMVETPHNHRRIEITTALGNNYARVYISDQGHGISATDKERLFEPFFTTKADGLGLGLAVCRRIIDAHGGQLWVTNNPERGACFCFTIPISSGDTVER